MKSTIRVLVLFAASIVIGGLQAKTINATTEEGRNVLLNSDGTWSYADKQKTESGLKSDYKKPPSSKKLIETINKHFSIWIDENKWTQSKTNDPNRFEFNYSKGDAGAIIISERIGMSMDSLKKLVLENARNAAKNAEIIFEEQRVVNGTPVLCLKMQGTIDGISFTYFGYYYASSAGTLQVITYTGQNLFKDYQGDFLDFLNGVKISQ